MRKKTLFRCVGIVLLCALLVPFFGCSDVENVQTAYRQAVSRSYSGTEKEFFTALAMETQGQGSAYQTAVEKGYTGTQSQWLTPLVGQTVETVDENATAFDIVVDNGYVGTSEQWLNSLPKEQEDLVISVKQTQPTFAWIDDDGKSYVYSTLYPWAVEYQVPFTTAVITRMANKYLTQEQILEMYQSGLVEVASHTVNHRKLPTLPDEQLEAEIKGSKETIESWGIPCNLIAYPFGEIDQRGLELVKDQYKYGLIAGGPQNSAGMPTEKRVNYAPISTYHIKRVGIGGEMGRQEIDMIKEQVDDACANNGLIVFMSHVSSNGAADLAVYTEIVEYIRSKGHDIEPAEEALDRFSNLVEVGGWSDHDPEGYLVIGADGSVRLDNLNGQVVMPNNSYTNASTPGSYPPNQITTCAVTGGSAGAGLPGAPRGTLTAYLTGSLGYRMYMPSTTTDLYVQIRSSTQDKWNDWVKVNSNVTSMLSNNKIDHTTRPNVLPSGVSMCIVTKAASLEILPGDGGMGYLTSYKLSTNSANVRQEWQPFDSVTTYIRLADTSTKWGPWYKLEPVLVEEAVSQGTDTVISE